MHTSYLHAVPTIPATKNLWLLSNYVLNEVKNWSPALQALASELNLKPTLENLASRVFEFGTTLDEDEAENLLTFIVLVRKLRQPDGFYETGDFYTVISGSDIRPLDEQELNKEAETLFPGCGGYEELNEEQLSNFERHLRGKYKKINSDELIDEFLQKISLK